MGDPRTAGQRAADRLASALEDVGFDVGVAFPGLHPTPAEAVEIGRVEPGVAVQVALVLAQAARAGFTVGSV